MMMWNDYDKIERRLDRIANAFERIADALETANIIEADRKTEPVDKDINVRSKTEPQTEDKLHDYCKKRNCVWWSRSSTMCLAERNGLACKYKSGKE